MKEQQAGAAVAEDFETEDLATEEMDSGMRLNPKRIAIYVVVVVAIVVALYFVLPKIAGLEDALAVAEDADPVWIAIALGLSLLSFVAYIALLRGIVGGRAPERVRERLDVRTSYQITLAGLAATRLFSAGGAGGIALTYWALRRAGMSKRETASAHGRVPGHALHGLPAGGAWCAGSCCGSGCSRGRARSG